MRSGGATNDEVDDFLDWPVTLCSKLGKAARYEAYRLLARILRKRCTSFGNRAIFDFDEKLKDYLRRISGRKVVDYPPREGSIYVRDTIFVKYVVRHLDDDFE